MSPTLQEILDNAEQLADAAEAHEPAPAEERDPASWHALRNAVAARATADQQITTAVQQMREAKYSWATIGGLLGTSAQAAQQRYGGSSAPAKSRARTKPRTKANLGVVETVTFAGAAKVTSRNAGHRVTKHSGKGAVSQQVTKP